MSSTRVVLQIGGEKHVSQQLSMKNGLGGSALCTHDYICPNSLSLPVFQTVSIALHAVLGIFVVITGIVTCEW